MTYTEYLKSRFGKDGSLARVLQELEKTVKEYSAVTYGYFNCNIMGEGNFLKRKICLRELEHDLYNQSQETQRKIAELLGRRE